MALGIGIGAIIFLLIVLGILALCRSRERKNDDNESHPIPPTFQYSMERSYDTSNNIVFSTPVSPSQHFPVENAAEGNAIDKQSFASVESDAKFVAGEHVTEEEELAIPVQTIKTTPKNPYTASVDDLKGQA